MGVEIDWGGGGETMGRVVEREWGGDGGERMGMVVEREWRGWWRYHEEAVERE